MTGMLALGSPTIDEFRCNRLLVAVSFSNESSASTEVEHATTGLSQGLDYVRAGDYLLVWQLDRLDRSLSHLLAIVTDLRFELSTPHHAPLR